MSDFTMDPTRFPVDKGGRRISYPDAMS